jgi:hypothetical protein
VIVNRVPRDRHHRTARLAVAVVGLSVLVVCVGCTAVTAAVPGCGSIERVALVAQSVPRASYIPCLRVLPPGWKTARFQATSGHTSFSLISDRAGGRPVDIELASACDVAGATPSPPRGPGVRTYTRLRSISPRYSGTLLDAFVGGCVSYQFDFPRGPHIALMEEFESAVNLYPRQELSLELHKRLGVTLDP